MIRSFLKNTVIIVLIYENEGTFAKEICLILCIFSINIFTFMCFFLSLSRYLHIFIVVVITCVFYILL